jgi:hypothetical protein
MPPVIVWIVGAVGVAFVAKWLAREGRRINAELDAARAQSAANAAAEKRSLERDPHTGVYRPK